MLYDDIRSQKHEDQSNALKAVYYQTINGQLRSISYYRILKISRYEWLYVELTRWTCDLLF